MAEVDRRIGAQAARLCDLDAAIGDGDHGTIMAAGASAAAQGARSAAAPGAGSVLTAAAAAFGSAAGGAGGILFSTFLRGMAEEIGDRETVPLRDLAAAIAAGVAAVRSRGRADPGDKTMVDALLPAAQTLQLAAAQHRPTGEALRLAAAAAASGRDATIGLVARRGRASYLGERSAHHLDPGAASATILLQALADTAQPAPQAHSALTAPPERRKTMPTPRQLINRPDDVISEALEGLAATYPGLLSLDAGSSLISRRAPAKDKVGLVSGGGSGHEPLHAGFVGTGMLDVAVAGAVFASPTAQQVQAGTALADSGRGVLQIVKNYTGDVLNFQIAAELAEDEGIQVDSVLVDDDLASDKQGVGPGRRGTAAVVTVEKICGALAEQGADLAAVAAAGREVVTRSRSLALALDGCTHPGSSTPAFTLGPQEVEFGVGIHGERGTGRIPFAPADELADQLIAPLVQDLSLRRGQCVIAIVNGLGGAYPLELSILARRVHHHLDTLGVTVARSLVGSYVTSLDMHGASLTLTVADDDLVAAWDAPVRTPHLTW
ncbi:hypothetical protein GCM10009793_34720 [Brachybacterium phenoliresistens]